MKKGGQISQRWLDRAWNYLRTILHCKQKQRESQCNLLRVRGLGVKNRIAIIQPGSNKSMDKHLCLNEGNGQKSWHCS